MATKLVDRLGPIGPMSRVGSSATLGLGCQTCGFFTDCGGIYNGFDCMSCCCSSPDTCTLACPRSSNFIAILRDSGGLDSRRQWDIRQNPHSPLPVYVPMIQHGFQRVRDLDLPLVALPTFEVTRRRVGDVTFFETAQALRSFFRIGATTRLILISVGEDAELERYWEHAHLDGLPAHLAAIRADLVTAPNFSFPLNVPRTEHLSNRRRSLICAEELSRAGINVAPHLSAVTQGDWDFWRDFLRDHAHISIVAKEFQTGGATRAVAQWHIDQLRRLEDALGRGLHLIAVAGRRHLPLLSGLTGFTVVDSHPFMKTIYRRRLSREDGRWKISLTTPGEPLDELLASNIDEYAKALSQNAARLKQYPLDFGDQPSSAKQATAVDDYGIAAHWCPPSEQMSIEYSRVAQTSHSDVREGAGCNTRDPATARISNARS